MRNRIILTAVAIGVIGFGLSGCDEPAYDGAGDRPDYTAEQQTQQAPRRQTGGGGGGSAYGGAMKAARGVAAKAEQHQQGIRDEIDD